MSCLCARCNSSNTCREGDHGCCLDGKYEFLYLVFGDNTEVIRMFGCALKAKNYAAETRRWLVQSIKLGDKTPIK